MGARLLLMSAPLPPELANAGRPLFPGNDVDDQLKRIFRYPRICRRLQPSGWGAWEAAGPRMQALRVAVGWARTRGCSGLLLRAKGGGHAGGHRAGGTPPRWQAGLPPEESCRLGMKELQGAG